MSLHSKAQKLSYKTLFLVIIFLLIPIVLLLRIGQRAHPASAGWFDDGWGYRKAVDITNSVGTTLTDFQVSISIGTSALINVGKMKSDCSDLRITNQTGQVLPHWIEENNPGCNAATDTKVWIKVPNIPSSGGTVYVYYGNPSANSTQAPNSVFDLFDDFNDNSINTSKWTYTDTSPIVTSETSGVLRRGGNGPATSYPVNTFTSKSYFNNHRIIESQIRINACTATEALLDLRTSVGDFTLRESSSTVKWQYYGSSWNDIVNSGISIGGEFVNTKLIDEATGSTIYENGSSLGTKSTAISAGTSQIKLPTRYYLSAGQTCSIDIDNIRVRKYASADPASSLSATEEISKAPVAYWSFDEGVGTTTYDSSSNRNNGGISGATWQTEDQCISGKCLYFDGTNDTVSIGGSNSFVYQDGNTWTVSAWFKTTASITGANGGKIIFTKGTGNAIPGFAVAIGQLNSSGYDNKVGFIVDVAPGNNLIVSSNSLPTINDNKWHHVEVVFDAKNYTKVSGTIYLDGVSSGLLSSAVNKSGWTTSATTTAAIGSDRAIGEYFPGFIDEPKIYPYARTAAEIKSDYNAGKAHANSGKGSSVNLGSNQKNSEAFSDGLVGYWKMDENVGTTTVDSSGSGNTATFGTGNSAPSWSTGKFGIGISFDGVDDYIDCGQNDNLVSLTNKVTVSTWVNRSSADTNGGIIAGVWWGEKYALWINGTGHPFAYFRGSAGSTTKTASGTVTDNTWTHIVMTFDRPTIRIFINGVEDASSPWTWDYDLAWSGGKVNFKIGGINSNPIDPQTIFLGNIDETRVYNRTLSPNEISQLYNYAPGPTSYWNFNEGTGTTAFDTGSNSINVPVSNSDWSKGKFGYGIKKGSGMNLGDLSLLEGQRQITVEFWTYPTLLAGTDREIFKKGAWTDADMSYRLMYQTDWGSGTGYPNGYWKFHIKHDGNNDCNASGPNGDSASRTNMWQHIAGTWDGSNIKIYINGVLTQSSGCAGTAINTNSYNAYLNYGMSGTVDDYKIYNYARTQKQIVEDMNAGHPNVGSPIASALAHYKFDEGFGTVTANWGNGGVGLSGVFGAGNSAPTWTNNGKFGKALSFDGNNDYVSITNTSALQPASALSVSAWIKTTFADKWYIHNSTSTYSENYGYALRDNYGPPEKQFMFRVGHGASSTVAQTPSSEVLSDNTWYHVVGTYDGSTAKIYLNGILKESIGAGSSISYSGVASNMYIGRRTDGFYANGSIDDVKIYNYALTSDEVKTDYNQGKSLVMGSLSTNTGNTAPSTASSQEYCVPGDTATCSPPVARWDFNEGVGTTVYDTSGSNNGVLATGSSSPTWTKGKVGSSLIFNGNDYITTNNTLQAIGTSDFTVEAWVKYNSIASGGSFAGGGIVGTPGLNPGWQVGIDNNGMKVYTRDVNGTSQLIHSTLPTLGVWTHITGIRNGTNLYLYYNGVQVNSIGTTIRDASNADSLRIGSAYIGYTDGSIDQVRIYNYARSPAQIVWDYNRGEPIAHYKMDECQGTVINDWSGNAKHGTLSIGASGTQTSAGTCQTASTAWGVGATGKINSSLNFDGTDDYINIGNSIPTLTEGSVSAWFKRTAGNGTYQMILTDSGSQLEICYSANTLKFYVDNSAVSTTGANNDGTWQHVTGVFSQIGNYKKIYLNGKEVDTAAYTGDATAATRYIGGRAGSFPFTGQIDDVQIFNYALTATQVKTLYSGGAVNFK